MADVFLSYRRDDSRSAAGRLMDHLQATLGPERVFRDVDSITPGLDFQAALGRTIGAARVVLAVIGPRWQDARDGAGRRRLDDPHDMVRLELEAALDAGVPIIPVLVEGARMPPAEALPPSLVAFARCQAITLDDEGWRDDTQRLTGVLRERYAVEPDLPFETAAIVAGTRSASRPVGRLTDMLELVARPRSIVTRLAGPGGTREVQRALLLLILCLVLGNLFIGAALGVELASWVLNGLMVCSLCAVALAGALALGWRLAGKRLGWQRAMAGAACMVGGAWLYLSTGLLVVTLGYALVQPATFQEWIAAVRRGTMSGPEMMAWAEMRARGPALAGIVIATVVWMAGAVWLVRAWNALRVAFAASGVAALIAAVGTFGVLGVVVAAARWAAQ